MARGSQQRASAAGARGGRPRAQERPSLFLRKLQGCGRQAEQVRGVCGRSVLFEGVPESGLETTQGGVRRGSTHRVSRGACEPRCSGGGHGAEAVSAGRGGRGTAAVYGCDGLWLGSDPLAGRGQGVANRLLIILRERHRGAVPTGGVHAVFGPLAGGRAARLVRPAALPPTRPGGAAACSRGEWRQRRKHPRQGRGVHRTRVGRAQGQLGHRQVADQRREDERARNRRRAGGVGVLHRQGRGRARAGGCGRRPNGNG
mmetsp:Transcript_9986/g.22243  ORF Transcript_9986/g.22243 Transcript_9986/m.22243 type:complete len:258 (-) Transcript_9986:562-1335(-)